MTDTHKKHIHKKAHWGQAFEPDVVEEVVEEKIAQPEVKEVVPEVVQSETPIVLPVEDPAYLERLYVEGLELLKLEDSTLKGYVKNLFRKKPFYEEVGKVYTKEGRELAVVMNTRGEKFARYDIYEKSGGTEKRSTTRTAYIPFKKLQPYLRK